MTINRTGIAMSPVVTASVKPSRAKISCVKALRPVAMRYPKAAHKKAVCMVLKLNAHLLFREIYRDF